MARSGYLRKMMVISANDVRIYHANTGQYSLSGLCCTLTISYLTSSLILIVLLLQEFSYLISLLRLIVHLLGQFSYLDSSLTSRLSYLKVSYTDIILSFSPFFGIVFDLLFFPHKDIYMT